MRRKRGKVEVVNSTINESFCLLYSLSDPLFLILEDKALKNFLSTGEQTFQEMENRNDPSMAEEFLSVMEAAYVRVKTLSQTKGFFEESYFKNTLNEVQESIDRLKLYISNRTPEVDLVNAAIHCFHYMPDLSDSLLECSDEYQLNPNSKTYKRLMEKIIETYAFIEEAGFKNSALMKAVSRLEAYRILNSKSTNDYVNSKADEVKNNV